MEKTRGFAEAQKFVDSYKLLDKSGKTLQDIYEIATLTHQNEKAAIYFDEDGKKRSYTYGRYKAMTFYLARHLSSALSGIPSGSIVALKIRNCTSWPHLFWSILMNGHPVLLIDSRLEKKNTENLLAQAGARAIVANEEEEYPIPSFRINQIKNAEEDDGFAPHWADEVYFCSSGTTGAAKIIKMEGHNLASQISLAKGMPKESPTILHAGKTNILAMIPFHHIFGFTAVFLWYTYYGKTIVYPTTSSIRDVFLAIKKAPCTHIYSVPMFWDGVAQTLRRRAALKGEKVSALLEKMIAYNCHQISSKEAGIASYWFIKRFFQKQVFGTHVEHCISGGGYLSRKTLETINGLGYPLYDGFGMSEVGVTSVELSLRVEDRLRGSIGHPLEGVEYKIDPSESDNPNVGELLIKSPTVHEEEIIGGVRKKTQLEGGYFRSGDIVGLDSTGSYFIKGRIKDTIIDSNGENVYPDEIESYFKDVKHVANSVVVGVKKDGREDIALVLELDNSVTKDELPEVEKDIRSINSTLPSEKRVDEILVYKKALPISASMKVKRFVLKEAIESGSPDLIKFGEKPSEVLSFEGFDQKEVDETVEKVRKIFSKTLLLPEFKIADDSVWTTDLGGDSMSYVSMVNDLDGLFRLSIPTELYGKLGTVKDFAHEILILRRREEKKGGSKQK